jgi:hypothetical protein
MVEVVTMAEMVTMVTMVEMATMVEMVPVVTMVEMVVVTMVAVIMMGDRGVNRAHQAYRSCDITKRVILLDRVILHCIRLTSTSSPLPFPLSTVP